jgi:hypothetical protein
MKSIFLIFLTLIVCNFAEEIEPFQSEIDDEICQNQLDLFTEALDGRETWALELFDTWSKVHAGYLRGNVQNLGNYDGCMRFQYDTRSSGTILPKYCLVTFQALPNSTLEGGHKGFDRREL